MSCVPLLLEEQGVPANFSQAKLYSEVALSGSLYHATNHEFISMDSRTNQQLCRCCIAYYIKDAESN